MSGTAVQNAIAVVGVDIGKNSFHVVGLDDRGAIVLRQKWSRSQVEARFANMPPCLIGMEACVGAHHLSRKLKTFGHNAKLMPAKYVRPYSKGQKNDFRDAEAIAEAVQRPTMKFVTTKTADQLDLQALHRVRERLVSQRLQEALSLPDCDAALQQEGTDLISTRSSTPTKTSATVGPFIPPICRCSDRLLPGEPVRILPSTAAIFIGKQPNPS